MAIVLADRNNTARRSDILPRVTARFGECGQPVFLFQSPRQAASERINRRLEQVLPGIARSTGQALSWPGRLAWCVVKTVLACASPQRWDFLVAALLPPWRVAARELARFIEALPHERVVIITHSAGGVAATRIAAHPKVQGIASFGYPFRHPERQREAYRTRHLRGVTKPMVVIQGQRDIYGGDPAQFGPLLGPACAIVSIDSDHDYHGLEDAEFARTWQAIAQVQQAACEKAVR
ncbi:alpha/beta family hydrolase [Novosphingobium pokkalii]|nr:hypothetical protein GCM10019060_40810 [Novosphingobium pokkalii]